MNKIVTPELTTLIDALENGDIPYKEHEKAVRYESMFAQMAEERCVVAVHCEGFWADSGSDAHLAWIESHYPHQKE